MCVCTPCICKRAPVAQCPHSAHTMPTQCPPQCPLGNRRVFGVWAFHKNIECEGLFSSFMLKLQMLDDSQSGHCGGRCVGTVWALCGHCVNSARPHIRGVLGRVCVSHMNMWAGIVDTEPTTLHTTMPTWESSSIWTGRAPLTQCPHNAHTVPTQCPPQCPLGNRRVFGL